MGVLATPTKVIRPVTITEAMLTSTNVTDSTAEYSSATTYAVDDLVKVTSTAGGASADTNKIYKSKTGSNTGNDPVTDTTNWEEVSSTNDWKMFDQVPQDQSSRAETMTIVLTPGQTINSFSLINVEAEQVVISATSAEGGGTVYNQTYGLIDDSLIGDWYEYFFEPAAYQSDFVVTDLPVYPDIVVTITITNTGGTVLVGALIIGQAAEIGSAAIGTQFGLTDYSTVNIDANGRFTIVPSTYSKRVELLVDCETRLWSGIQSVFHDLRNQAVVWVADESLKGSVLYGYYRNFTILVGSPALTRVRVTLQGLTAT